MEFLQTLIGIDCPRHSIFYPLSAKEIFDIPYASEGLNYSDVKTASFFFSGTESIDVDAMVKSISKGKANVVVTGKTSLEGEALSPGITTYVIVRRNAEDRS